MLKLGLCNECVKYFGKLNNLIKNISVETYNFNELIVNDILSLYFTEIQNQPFNKSDDLFSSTNTVISDICKERLIKEDVNVLSEIVKLKAENRCNTSYLYKLNHLYNESESKALKCFASRYIIFLYSQSLFTPYISEYHFNYLYTFCQASGNLGDVWNNRGIPNKTEYYYNKVYIIILGLYCCKKVEK